MSDKSSKPDPGQPVEGGKALELSEGARSGGIIIPVQTAPLDITNQVGGAPPAESAPATPPSSGGKE